MKQELQPKVYAVSFKIRLNTSTTSPNVSANSSTRLLQLYSCAVHWVIEFTMTRSDTLSNSWSDILHLLGVRIIPAVLKRRSTAALLGSVKLAFVKALPIDISQILITCWLWFNEIFQFLTKCTTCCFILPCGTHKAHFRLRLLTSMLSVLYQQLALDQDNDDFRLRLLGHKSKHAVSYAVWCLLANKNQF